MGTKATLQFAGTDLWPRHRVVSTARKGDKYASLQPGDVVHLEYLGGDTSIGDAVLVVSERVTFKDVLDNFDHNHAVVARGLERDAQVGRRSLRADLERAYGPTADSDTFHILHLLYINQ